jgi:protein tyrosine phosphatase
MFVCLQKEYDDTLPEEAWRYGRAMRPYWNDVLKIISNTQNFPSLTVAIDASKLQFVHCPIVDMNITDDSVILNLAHKLVKAMSEGHVLYIHCWGGHGRTGTLVCIMLHLMYGIDAQTSIAYCQHVHDMRHATAFAKSPQTQSQCKQVIDVIKSCNLHRKNCTDALEILNL